MKPAPIVHGPVLADQHTTLLASIRRMFAAGVEEGPFAVLGRDGPTGAEMVVWIGDERDPQGFATFLDAGDRRAWLDLVYVPPAMRRRGLAKALVSAAVRAGQGQGYEYMLVGALFGDARMATVLWRLGFEPLSTLYGRLLCK